MNEEGDSEKIKAFITRSSSVGGGGSSSGGCSAKAEKSKTEPSMPKEEKDNSGKTLSRTEKRRQEFEENQQKPVYFPGMSPEDDLYAATEQYYIKK